VTSNDKSFASKGLDTRDTFEHTFVHEGDFSYFCTLHPFMTATLHVRKQLPELKGALERATRDSIPD
jgi:plastocyanin